MATDYLHTIGDQFYNSTGFAAEAAQLGISRRITRLPADFVIGESRVYCMFGAGHDSAPRKCSVPDCGTALSAPHRNVRGLPETTCPKCGFVYEGKARGLGTVSSYFIPKALDVVLRVTDADTRLIAQGYVGLGVLDAKLEDTPSTLRVSATVTEENAMAVLEALADCTGVEVKADLLAPVLGRPGARMMVVGTEPKRGCGVRKHGGSYLVAGGQSPLVCIDPVSYDGPHFRGLRALNENEAAQLRLHEKGMVVCSLPIDAPVPVRPPAPPVSDQIETGVTAALQVLASGPARFTAWSKAAAEVAQMPVSRFTEVRRALQDRGLIVRVNCNCEDALAA